MANETYVTIIGTLSKDPEQKFTPSGAGVTKISVVTNARKFNKQTNEWEKKTGKFWDAEAWNQGSALLADNVANSLKKGDTVVVYGELETREYTTKDGENRRVDQIRIEGVGKDLRWHQSAANDVPAQQGGGWGGGSSNAGAWGNNTDDGVPF